MACTSAAVTFTDASYSLEDMVDGFGMFRPPRRAGRANKLLIKSLIPDFPVIAGMSFSLMASSSGFSMSAMFGIVRMKQTHLPVRPCVRAAYASCGWVVVMDASFVTSSIQFSTFSFM